MLTSSLETKSLHQKMFYVPLKGNQKSSPLAQSESASVSQVLPNEACFKTTPCPINPSQGDTLMTTPHALEGRTIGKYRIDQAIGGGGQATVYKAWHLDFQNPVAIKVLQSQFAEKPVIRERFKQEARLQFQLQHPHIIRVFEVLEEDDILAMVMDWTEGTDLECYLEARQTPLDNEEIERLFLPVLRAVGFAHQKKIIHRDLKPSNILLSGPPGQETPKVMDFGIAKSLEDDSKHTKTNALLGTPHYIAPEHASSSKYVDHRVDIYALGVTLYQLLCGHLPFEGGDLVQLITAHLTLSPPPIDSWGVRVDPALEQVARKAMNKRPQDRFQTCEDFAKALQAALQHDTETLTKLLGVSEPSTLHFSPQPQDNPLPTGEMDAYPQNIEQLETFAKKATPSSPSLLQESTPEPTTQEPATQPSPFQSLGLRIRFMITALLLLVVGGYAWTRWLSPPQTSPSTSLAKSAIRKEIHAPPKTLPPKTNLSSKKKSPAIPPQRNTPTISETKKTLDETKKALAEVKRALAETQRAIAAQKKLALQKTLSRPKARKRYRGPTPYRWLSPVSPKRFVSCRHCLYAFWLARKRFRKDACKLRPLRVAARRCSKICKTAREFCSSYGTVLPYLDPFALRNGGSEKMSDMISRCAHNIFHQFNAVFEDRYYKVHMSLPAARCTGRFRSYAKGKLQTRGRATRFGWAPYDRYPSLP